MDERIQKGLVSINILMEIFLKKNKLSILTSSPDFFGRLHLFNTIIRRGIKDFLFFTTRRPRFQSMGGPQGVVSSLLKGFQKLGVEYNYNPTKNDVGDIVCVLSGTDALRWAINAKRTGRIKKIIAGPNLVFQTDAGVIVVDDEIDRILVPARWLKDSSSVIANHKVFKRVMVWAAGVDEVFPSTSMRNILLVYKKDVSEKIFSFVLCVLNELGISYRVLEYGRYKKDNYFRMLSIAQGLIYLTKTETQGLALAEAWMHNVPTLVWNPGFFERDGIRVPTSSAPYLTDECGVFFSKKSEFL